MQSPREKEGKNEEELANQSLRTQLFYATQIIYACAIMTAKLSILALYWRLFPTPFVKRGCVVLAALTAMWCVAGVLVDIFQCTPVGKAFATSFTGGGGGHCISQSGYCLGLIIPNILIDVMMLCLPTLEVSKLHLPRGQRCALASVFLLGAGVTSAAGVRLYYHLNLLESGTGGDFDFTSEFHVVQSIARPLRKEQATATQGDQLLMINVCEPSGPI